MAHGLQHVSSMDAAIPTTCTVNGREYTVTRTESGEKYPNVFAAMVKAGWDGHHYLLTGKRGAQWMGYRNATTGEFELISNLR